jgi:probable rRNA maturation factor
MIDLVIDDEEWTRVLPAPEELARRCHAAAAQLEPGLDGEIALLLTDDRAMQALNKRFRSKDAPTNVLSFPSGGDKEFIGDIALARETCEQEAVQRNIAIADHAAHLIVHGMLHLIGYDHQADAQANAMEHREAEILACVGISDPYTEELEKTT